MADVTTINQNATHFSVGLPNADDAGCLVRIYPSDNGPCGLWNLEKDLMVIGRAADCDIHLDDDSVSREHAEIRRETEGYVLHDLESTNGTWVNDERVSSTLLTAGDRVRWGSQIVKFLSSDHIESQYNETVYKTTTTDGLTAAHNKRYMLDVLGRSIARTRHGGRPVTLIMMDIDFFKQVNDNHGHLAGDEVLQEFAHRVSDNIEEYHVFCRYGGEEFFLIIDEGSAVEARQIGEKIREIVSAHPFDTHVGPIDITVSLGLASTSGKDCVDQLALIARAEEKLCEAKHSGRNKLCW